MSLLFVHMFARCVKIGLLVAIASALGACAARHDLPASRKIIRPEAVNPALVTRGGEMQEIVMRAGEPEGWEAFRNHGPVLDWEVPAFSPRVLLEVRHREHLRTISGRPREFSSTITRTIRREFSP